MNRFFTGMAVLLVIASCKDPGSRPDSGVQTGGSGGAGPAVGSAGAGGAGLSAGSRGAGGTGGSAGSAGTTRSGGAGGTGFDAGVDQVADAGGADDGPGVVVDAAADGGRTLEPIRVVEGKSDASAATYNDLRFLGVGLDQYEGAVVTFRIGPSTGTWRTSSGQVRIVQGGFDVLFPQAIAPIYETKLAHIDADGSGACEVGEPSFLDNGLASTDLTLTFSPDDLRVRPASSGSCDSINTAPAPQSLKRN